MGLDLSVDEVFDISISYSDFEGWREHISLRAGIDRDKLLSRAVQRRNGYGYWEETPNEPLDVLLIHHDDAGYIFPRDAKALSERLNLLSLRMKDSYYKWFTMQMCILLDASVETGSPVVFK